MPTAGYSAETGHGFATPLAATDCRDRGGDDLAGRDFVLPTAGSSFRADVPDGLYTVVVRTGDLIASGNTGFTVGGQTAAARGAASGTIDERTLDGVQATDGHLEFVFSGSSIRLNSIQILHPIAAPAGLTASITATSSEASVGLSWQPVEGAHGYRVYRGADGAEPVALADVDPATDPRWTDSTVELAGTYTYQVTTLGPSGRESARSEPVTVHVVDEDAAVPSAPKAVPARWVAGGVRLTWHPVRQAVAYDVYRSRPGREPARITRATGAELDGSRLWRIDLGITIPAANFLTWWDGDLLREIGDHDYDATTGAGVPTIAEWDPATGTSDAVYRASGTLSNNGTKGNISLQADLHGDWREEIVTRLEDSSALRIATTVDATQVRLRTLMSDPAYRLAVAWQNTGYNQPPHTSYHLGQGMRTPPAPRLVYTTDGSGR